MADIKAAMDEVDRTMALHTKLRDALINKIDQFATDHNSTVGDLGVVLADVLANHVRWLTEGKSESEATKQREDFLDLIKVVAFSIDEEESENEHI